MNWKYFEQEIDSLAELITAKPDIIVGITRGGVVPARLLSTLLNVKDMFCISVAKQDEKRKVMTDVQYDISNKTILLVEDMLETGRSLTIAKEYLQSKGATVKTACLYTMPTTEEQPDFSLKIIEEVQNFPWEKK